jgi:hypothetical protein
VTEVGCFSLPLSYIFGDAQSVIYVEYVCCLSFTQRLFKLINGLDLNILSIFVTRKQQFLAESDVQFVIGLVGLTLFDGITGPLADTNEVCCRIIRSTNKMVTTVFANEHWQ